MRVKAMDQIQHTVGGKGMGGENKAEAKAGG